jgi:hypothetical protein
MKNKPGNGKQVLKTALTGMGTGAIIGSTIHPDNLLYVAGSSLLGGMAATGVAGLKGEGKRNKSFNEGKDNSRR